MVSQSTYEQIDSDNSTTKNDPNQITSYITGSTNFNEIKDRTEENEDRITVILTKTKATAKGPEIIGKSWWFILIAALIFLVVGDLIGLSIFVNRKNSKSTKLKKLRRKGSKSSSGEKKRCHGSDEKHNSHRSHHKVEPVDSKKEPSKDLVNRSEETNIEVNSSSDRKPSDFNGDETRTKLDKSVIVTMKTGPIMSGIWRQIICLINNEIIKFRCFGFISIRI